MKQVLQNLSNGSVEVVDIPAPAPKPGHLVIQTSCSLISPGTERMLRDFGKASLIGKIMQQPQRVRDVLQKASTDGLLTTLEAVKSKLDQPTPVGYCNVGRIISVASDVDGFAVGDRVVSNGSHAAIVRAPKNLAAKIPDNVSDDQALFTVLGSIALQGIRLAAPTLGECAVVTGLGLIGLLAVQLLRANGVRVLGVDLDPARCELARQFGAETVCVSEGQDPVARAQSFSRGRGADMVLICAATKSNTPIEQAAQMARAKGRVVLVGVVGLQLPRDEFYKKELTFQVSCSYGPGRYEPAYEEKGQDYPIGQVRWTEQRNFEAVLDMMADGRLNPQPFINCRFPIEQAAKAYDSLDSGGGTLGIVLEYPHSALSAARVITASTAGVGTVGPKISGAVHIGAIGAGNYAARNLLPAFAKAGAAVDVVCASSGVSSGLAAKKFGAAKVSSDANDVFGAPGVNLAVVATRHDDHASFVVRALRAGKAVFVEKPLALTEDEFKEIEAAYKAADKPFLMVGFNRRFSPFTVNMKKAVQAASAPAAIVMMMNAGAIPAGHWTQDKAVGGGRIIGEACHYIDLARHLAGSPIVSFDATALGNAGGDANPEDKALITLKFANGSAASIQYLANGNKSFPKERVEVFCGGKSWQIDNFRRLNGFGSAGLRGGVLGGQDKGQTAMAAAVVKALTDGASSPIAFEELREVALISIEIDRKLRGQ